MKKLRLKVIIAGRGEYFINGFRRHIKDLEAVKFLQDIDDDGEYQVVEL